MSKQHPAIAEVVDRAPAWLSLVGSMTDEALSHVRGADDRLLQALGPLVAGVSASDTLSTTFASAVLSTEATNPRLDFIQQYGLRDFTLLSEVQDQRELSGLLTTIDPTLESMRKSAWESLSSGAEQRLLQAAHLMREVLRQLISKYASNERVKRCPWWTHSPDARDGVTPKQRIRCLVFGDAPGTQNDDEAQLIDTEIDQYDRECKLLMDTAHGSSRAKHVAVEAAMRKVEQLMLFMLRRRSSSRDRQGGAL
jgi:hypothetical protein